MLGVPGRKEYTMRIITPKKRWTVDSSGGYPTVTVSSIDAGEEIYAERNSCVACSTIYTGEKDEHGNSIGGMERGRVMSESPETKGPTRMARAILKFNRDVKETIDRKILGERSYISYKALKDKQKATFIVKFPGMIMLWDATPMEEDEVFVEDEDYYKHHRHEKVRSVFNEDLSKRPHGKINVVKGSFLVADMCVKANVFHVDDPGIKIKSLSGTDNTFQQFSGEGMVAFEVHGTLQEIPLYPGEAVDVFVGYLLGFTEGVELAMKPAGNAVLRNEENSDYVIRLTAGEKGGYVYTHSVRIPDAHKKINPEFFSRADQLVYKTQQERVQGKKD